MVQRLIAVFTHGCNRKITKQALEKEDSSFGIIIIQRPDVGTKW